jgi:hypothetical protein
VTRPRFDVPWWARPPIAAGIAWLLAVAAQRAGVAVPPDSIGATALLAAFLVLGAAASFAIADLGRRLDVRSVAALGAGFGAAFTLLAAGGQAGLIAGAPVYAFFGGTLGYRLCWRAGDRRDANFGLATGLLAILPVTLAWAVAPAGLQRWLLAAPERLFAGLVFAFWLVLALADPLGRRRLLRSRVT